MNTEKLKDAIIAAGVSRNIVEAGAPVSDETLLNIVACLGMGPKQVVANTTVQALKQSIKDIETVLRIEGMDLEIGSRKLLREVISTLTAASAEAQPSQDPQYPICCVKDDPQDYGYYVEWSVQPPPAGTLLYTHPQPSAPVAQEDRICELGKEIARLQDALCFWLPNMPAEYSPIAERIANDAFLLRGIDGNLPDDFKSAEELGWITLAAAPSSQKEGEQP